MIIAKKLSSCGLLALLLILPLLPVDSQAQPAEKTNKNTQGAGGMNKPFFAPMADPGKKVAIGNGYYLIYGFDKKPKLGTVVMKVEIFTAEGKKDTSLQIKADAGMPSMSGAHETGDKPFVLSRKGDYLLPVSIVMPGDWEVRFTVMKEGKVLFRGRYNFDV